jgi:aminoglycoside phosphotransferase family enzyme
VTSFLLDDPHVPPEDRERARVRAQKLFKLAKRYAEEIKV